MKPFTKRFRTEFAALKDAVRKVNPHRRKQRAYLARKREAAARP